MASAYNQYISYDSFSDVDLSNANPNIGSMNGDDWETFNMQCNIALLSLLNNQRQSRNAMMTPPILSDYPGDYEDLDLSLTTLSGSEISSLSSTTTTPSNSPQYGNARICLNPPAQDIGYRETEAYAHKHKRVAELAKSPRSKASKPSKEADTRERTSSGRLPQKSTTSPVDRTDHYSKYMKHQQR